MEIIENNSKQMTEQSDFSLGDIWGMGGARRARNPRCGT